MSLTQLKQAKSTIERKEHERSQATARVEHLRSKVAKLESQGHKENVKQDTTTSGIQDKGQIGKLKREVESYKQSNQQLQVRFSTRSCFIFNLTLV